MVVHFHDSIQMSVQKVNNEHFVYDFYGILRLIETDAGGSNTFQKKIFKTSLMAESGTCCYK